MSKCFDKLVFINYDIDKFKREHGIETISKEGMAFINKFSHLSYIKYKCIEHLREYETAMFMDLDVLIRDDLNELFSMQSDIAWRNGDSFHKKFFSGNSRAISDGIQNENFPPQDMPAPNGGLVIVKNTFDIERALILGKEFLKKYINYFYFAIDELVFSHIAFHLNLNINQLDYKKYNVLPVHGKSSSSLFHFVGPRKPWTDKVVNGCFYDWSLYYFEFEKRIQRQFHKLDAFSGIGADFYRKALFASVWHELSQKLDLETKHLVRGSAMDGENFTIHYNNDISVHFKAFLHTLRYTTTIESKKPCRYNIDRLVEHVFRGKKEEGDSQVIVRSGECDLQKTITMFNALYEYLSSCERS